MRSRTRLVLILVAAAVLVAAIVVAVNLGGSPKRTISGATVRSARIPAAGAITLSAQVVTPRGGRHFPLVVMPASWGAPAKEYRAVAIRLARQGYQVVAYAQRGFGGSGGSVDFAGPITQHDVSTVIDWALGHTAADRTHIGLFGMSLGAGVSLLAAAHDPRVRAVVATSAWSDLADALAPHGTLDRAGLAGLFRSPRVVAALDAQVRALAIAAYRNPGQATALLTQMSATRSPDRELSALNRNRPAIMIANAFEDSLLDPSSLISFYDQLRTPKRLQMATGDHAGPEWPALYGRPDATVASAIGWLDRYLKGGDGTRADQVTLQDGATGQLHTYRSWPTAGVTFQLGAPDEPDDMAREATAGWSRTLTSGTDSGADVGGTSALAFGRYYPAKIPIASLRSQQAAVWSTAPASITTVIGGSPALRIRTASAAPAVTVYAYLYDVDQSGTATLMSYAPATAAPGDLSIALRPVSRTIASGNRLAVVVDTADPHFASSAPAGTGVTLSGPASLFVPASG